MVVRKGAYNLDDMLAQITSENLHPEQGRLYILVGRGKRTIRDIEYSDTKPSAMFHLFSVFRCNHISRVSFSD